MKYSARDRMVRELREAADFIEQTGHLLPGTPYISTTIYLSLTETKYEKNEAGEYTSSIDEEKTKLSIRRFLDAVGSCEKDYKDDRLTITKKNSDGNDMIRANVDRSVACKRVIKSQKMVPAKLVDEIEWVCDDGMSLLKLVS